MLWALADNPMNGHNLWLLVAVAGATILYAVFRPSTKKKKDPLARSSGQRSLAQQRNVERQMESLLVELSDMSRQITAQLDTRSAKLEALIHDADNRIAQLQQLAAGTHGELPAGAASSSRPSSASDASGDESHATASQSSAALAATMAVEPMPPNPQHAQVYALADLGTAATDIARQLNRPRGEVELILALRPRGG